MTVATPRAGAIDISSSATSRDAALGDERAARLRALRDGAPAAAMAALDAAPYEGPRLAMELRRVDEAYRALERGLGDVAMYYAVKANPHPAVIARLAALGAAFDAASRGEIQRCLDLGVAPERISFGNTVKREADIAWAASNGVRLFAFDALEELEKIARAAPGAGVFGRLRVDDLTADLPLAGKFGCSGEMLETLLMRADALGLSPRGLSFHVGSQMSDPAAWRRTIAEVARIWRRLGMRGAPLELLNIGGGFPAAYGPKAVDLEAYGAEVRAAIADAFGSAAPRLIMAEPGRGLVAEAGVLEAEVLLVSRKSESDPRRWVYLDVGRYGGLAETEGEAIRYPILTDRDGGPTGPCSLAGPTCDSVDVIYERAPVELPLDLKAGDRVRLLGAGAYIATYASQWFNGFEPMREIVVD